MYSELAQEFKKKEKKEKEKRKKCVEDTNESMFNKYKVKDNQLLNDTQEVLHLVCRCDISATNVSGRNNNCFRKKQKGRNTVDFHRVIRSSFNFANVEERVS